MKKQTEASTMSHQHRPYLSKNISGIESESGTLCSFITASSFYVPSMCSIMQRPINTNAAYAPQTQRGVITPSIGGGVTEVGITTTTHSLDLNVGQYTHIQIHTMQKKPNKTSCCSR